MKLSKAGFPKAVCTTAKQTSRRSALKSFELYKAIRTVELLMSNLTALQGLCPAPFLQESNFPATGGYNAGRFCAVPPGFPAEIRCCLSCPSTSWTYPDNFYSLSRTAGWINVASLVCCVVLLLSFAFLPVEKSRRHYLSVSLVVAIIVLELGFIIPLAARPNQCYNEITPNDMYSDMTCAWSGSFLILGGLAINMWIFLRALSMHLQIVWDISPGRRFFWLAQLSGWGIPAILLAATLAATGVSYRFGDTCHVNHAHSLADFWGPLLGIACLSTLFQLGTLGYCFHVYLRNLWSDENQDSNSSNGLPSYNPSYHSQRARAVWRRVKKVVWLQWRGLAIVIAVLVDVIFFAVVFVYMDNSTDSVPEDVDRLMPWLTCLVLEGGNKNKCLYLTNSFIVNEATTMAILILMAAIGIQAGLLLGRLSMVAGWWAIIRPSGEFVSLDAKRLSIPNSPHPYARQAQPSQPTVPDPRTYELLKFGSPVTSTVTTTVTSPAVAYRSPISSCDGLDLQDYFSKEAEKPYRPPSQSFSNPRPPGPGVVRIPIRSGGWDPATSAATGGLGLHPLSGEERNRIRYV